MTTEQKEKIQSLIMGLVDESETKKSSLVSLKNLAVKAQKFELASLLREIEREKFPPSEEEEAAKKIQLVLQMVRLNCSEEVSWKVYETMKGYFEKKGEFSIEDSSKIIAKATEIFSEP